MKPLQQLLIELAAVGELADAAEQHCVVVTDPDTGQVYVYGPYPDQIDAGAALLTLKQRYEDEDLPDLRLRLGLYCEVTP